MRRISGNWIHAEGWEWGRGWAKGPGLCGLRVCQEDLLATTVARRGCGDPGTLCYSVYNTGSSCCCCFFFFFSSSSSPSSLSLSLNDLVKTSQVRRYEAKSFLIWCTNFKRFSFNGAISESRETPFRIITKSNKNTTKALQVEVESLFLDLCTELHRHTHTHPVLHLALICCMVVLWHPNTWALDNHLSLCRCTLCYSHADKKICLHFSECTPFLSDTWFCVCIKYD